MSRSLLDCYYLFSQSPDHRLYTLVEFQQYAVHPIIHEKIMIFRHDDRPVGLVTWAWLTAEEEQQFLSERWMPTEEVWQRPDVINPEYRLWGIDFIAPFGDTTKIMKAMMRHSQSVLGQRVPARWRRLREPDKIHQKEF